MTPRTPRAVFASLVVLAFATLALGGPSSAATRDEIVLGEYTIDHDAMCAVRDEWLATIRASYPEGSWAPMRVELTDTMLAELGLPDRGFWTTHRFPEPTLVMADGSTHPVDVEDIEQVMAQGATSYAGTGCLGIRPGAFLLTLTSNTVGWCSLAHAYGSPGNYQISTAGHCGKNGDIGTVIAATGNRAGAAGIVVLDFGKYVKSTGDGGLGNDWALLSVDAPWQRLVSPTMCFWGGPIGMYSKVGDTVAIHWPRRGTPSASANPDPLLVQTIVHYGHGTGVGAGGTPRVAEAFAWRSSHFMFTGAISPGDSGSGSNTLGGDTVGAHREAAGINTHLWVEGDMGSGIGIMGGTRATKVSASLANGQLVPYPAPVPGAP